MIQNIFYALFLSSFVNASWAMVNVNDLMSQVDFSNLRRHIVALEKNVDVRSKVAYATRSAHRVEAAHSAAEYIATQLSSNPLLRVEVVKSDGVENVVATLEGTERAEAHLPRIYIIAAHYDSSASNELDWNPITSPAPGADDNASGVAAMLEAARILSRLRYRYSIKFVAFGASEIGYWGSRTLALKSSQSGEQIAGLINLDTIGNNSKRDQIDVASNSDSEWLSQAVLVINSWGKIGLKVNERIVPEPFPGDHKPFWEFGYRAITLTENISPHQSSDGYETNRYYHTYQDTFDNLNLGLIRKVCQLAIAVSFQLANMEMEDGRDGIINAPSPLLNIDPKPSITYQSTAVISGSYMSDMSDLPVRITLQPGDIEIEINRKNRSFSFPVNLKAGRNIFRINLFSLYSTDYKVLEFTYIPPFQLKGVVFPNPASEVATFHCEATRSLVSMEVMIYSVSGEFVRWLSGVADKDYSYVWRTWWNLKNSDGDMVSDGVYVCRVIVNDGETKLSQVLKLAIER